jgi:shikimate kinase
VSHRPNLILVGLMGCGKSSIGRILSARLGCPYRDVDALIEKEQGRSIVEIFAKEGEAHFRGLEREMIRRIADERGIIVSIGGGAFVDPENRAALKEAGITVYLRAEPEVLYERVRHSSHRPLLAGDDGLAKLRALLEAREPAYREAHCTIETDAMSSLDVARALTTMFYPLEPSW